MSDQIRREFTVNYSIDHVMKSIEAVCATKPSVYGLKKNDAFNSYSLMLAFNLYAFPVAIQLKKITETSTTIILEATLGTNTRQMPTATNKCIDDFLGLVGRSLKGENLAQSIPKGGCMVTLLFIGIILTTILCLAF